MKFIFPKKQTPFYLIKKVKLILIFYRNFWFFNFLITAICSLLFWEYGFSIYRILFWLKVSTLFLTYNFIRTYKRNEFYYYQNLGISKTVLWAYTLSFEMVTYFFLLAQVNKLR